MTVPIPDLAIAPSSSAAADGLAEAVNDAINDASAGASNVVNEMLADMASSAETGDYGGASGSVNVGVGGGQGDGFFADAMAGLPPKTAARRAGGGVSPVLVIGGVAVVGLIGWALWRARKGGR